MQLFVCPAAKATAFFHHGFPRMMGSLVVSVFSPLAVAVTIRDIRGNPWWKKPSAVAVTLAARQTNSCKFRRGVLVFCTYVTPEAKVLGQSDFKTS
jgi:hypothetical protein